MPAGKLLSAHAYEVAPKQKSGFVGGAVAATAQLEAALNTTFDRSKIATAPVVTFEVDVASPSRSHPIRDAVRTLAFTAGPHEPVVEVLTGRLADSMDNRSKPTLLMASVHEAGAAGHRRVLLWTFPQQEVFNLQLSHGKAKLELLEAFNRESSLRKVALVEGPDARTGMLTARVRDFQVSEADRAVADLWVSGFLAARLQMNDSEGTKLLAQALRNAHNKTTDDQHAQDQILAAITGLRIAGNSRQSLDQVAKTYLSGAAADAFLANTTADTRAAIFSIDLTKFDHLLQYTRFTLGTGVVVSAPFAALESADSGVEVTEANGERRLRVEGRIEEEQVRTRA